MLFYMFFSIFLLAKAAKLHISRQRYCFFRTYARARAYFFRKKAKIIYLPDNTLLLRVYYEYIRQLPITDKILQYKNKKRVQTFVQTPYRIFLMWCIHQLISSIFLIGLIASCATCLSTKISPVSLRRQS